MCNHKNLKIHRSHGVTVSTQDSESCDRGSNPREILTWVSLTTTVPSGSIINQLLKLHPTVAILIWFGQSAVAISIKTTKHMKGRVHPRRDTLAPAISGLWLHELLDSWLMISCFFVGMSLVKEVPSVQKKKGSFVTMGNTKRNSDTDGIQTPAG